MLHGIQNLRHHAINDQAPPVDDQHFLDSTCGIMDATNLWSKQEAAVETPHWLPKSVW